jgi:beta-phosphoglucomutase-like phosphatase (HAD superfamily)
MRKNNKPKAVLFDFDGTFCNVQPNLHLLDHSDPHLTNFHEATHTADENEKVFGLLQDTQAAGLTPLLVSVRGEMWRGVTTDWLSVRDFVPEHFHMRRDDDTRPHAEVKREIIRALKEEFDIIAGVDDDPKNIVMFEEEGIRSIFVPGHNGIDDPDTMEIPDWWDDVISSSAEQPPVPSLHVPTRVQMDSSGALCYFPVKSADGAPCILKTPHGGKHRSRVKK